MKQEQQILVSALRHVVTTDSGQMRPYDRYGTQRDDMLWLPLFGNANDGFECFLLEFKPGTRSTPHKHSGYEHFYMLDGEIEDSDGTVLRAGDFVSYEPGSKHFSESKTGCTMLVVLRGQNVALGDIS